MGSGPPEGPQESARPLLRCCRLLAPCTGSRPQPGAAGGVASRSQPEEASQPAPPEAVEPYGGYGLTWGRTRPTVRPKRHASGVPWRCARRSRVAAHSGLAPSWPRGGEAGRLRASHGREFVWRRAATAWTRWGGPSAGDGASQGLAWSPWVADPAGAVPRVSSGGGGSGKRAGGPPPGSGSYGGGLVVSPVRSGDPARWTRGVWWCLCPRGRAAVARGQAHSRRESQVGRGEPGAGGQYPRRGFVPVQRRTSACSRLPEASAALPLPAAAEARALGVAPVRAREDASSG
jgi:hypothetical protein